MKDTTWNGAALRKRRALLEMNQEDVADALDVSDGTVSAWETNARAPDEQQRRALARLLRCKPAQLCEEPRLA